MSGPLIMGVKEQTKIIDVRNETIPFVRVLGTRVHMIEIPDVVALMDHWIEAERDRSHHIVNSGMHGIMEAHRDDELKSVFNSVELFAPDGILMVLLGRLRGFRLNKKNTGPQLLWEFGHVANEKGYKYYIYGDEEHTLQRLRAKLQDSFPGLPIVGCYSPPFRPLTPEEDEAAVRTINEANPDVLWVGLGMPNQERWIANHRDKLNVPVLVGAGAAFKFLSGDLRRAPSWLGNFGFEWLWRLFWEPGRVWRRVVIDAPLFIGMVALELCGVKKYR